MRKEYHARELLRIDRYKEGFYRQEERGGLDITPSRYAMTNNRTGLALPIIGRVRYSSSMPRALPYKMHINLHEKSTKSLF
jgi:hypothetical protein